LSSPNINSKAITVIFSIVVLFLFLINAASAQERPTRPLRGYVTFGGGAGGDAKATNLRLEGGAYTVTNTVNLLFGLGLPFTINRDETPSNLRDYEVPHWNFTDLGTRRKGEEVGLYAKFGIAPIKNFGLFIFGTGGFTSGKEIRLAQSNITGWYYTEEETTKTYGLYGGGIGYFPISGHFTIHAQYDNRMGFTGSLGFVW
jgi:hypothetical protein